MFDCQTILDHLPDGLYTVTRMRKITSWNRAAEAITGFRAEEVKSRRCYDGILKHIDGDGVDLCNNGCPLDWAMAHQRPHQADIFLHHKEGYRVPVRVKVVPVYDASGTVIGAIESFADNTERMLALERLAELEESALLDPLTHLANSTYLEQQVQVYLREMKRQPQNIGVLVIELDEFDQVSEQLEVADRNRILRVMARTIRGNCRPMDLFGHVDHGCFIGLLHDATSSQLYIVARKLEILIQKSHCLVNGQPVKLAASIGGTMLLANDTLQSAVARCERHIYLARQKGCRVNIETGIPGC